VGLERRREYKAEIRKKRVDSKLIFAGAEV
jgi:hypothetical protein